MLALMGCSLTKIILNLVVMRVDFAREARVHLLAWREAGRLIMSNVVRIVPSGGVSARVYLSSPATSPVLCMCRSCKGELEFLERVLYI